MSIPQFSATSLEPTRLSIMGRIEGYPRLRGVQVSRGPLTGEGAPMLTEQGMLNGYVVVNFGGRGVVAGRWQGITGTRNDLRRLTIGAEIYAPNTTARDRIADDVFDALEGFEPYNCGEMSNQFSGALANPIRVAQNISREGIGLIFSCYVGTITPVDPDEPDLPVG